MLKLLYLVLDGVADRINGETSLEVAETPGLNELVSKAKCGLQYSIGRGIAPESDVAVISILGYDPHKYYTGRGPLEALGVNIKIKEGSEVAFRANFATVDADSEDLVILDRRCGRDLSSEEAKELAKAVDDLDLGIDDGYVRVQSTVGHRGVIVLGSELGLSDNVGNTDPAYAKVGKISTAKESYESKVSLCEPLEDTSEAKRTAELANIFTRKALEVLDSHPVNQKRESLDKLKGNILLLRDAGGSLPKVKPINEVFQASFAAVTEMPVENGVAKLLGMDTGEVSPPTENKKADLEERLERTEKLLEKHNVVYTHLKGPDEPGHDGDFKRKVQSIEEIDRYFVRELLKHYDLSELAVLVTADHATPPELKVHSDDPIPFMIAYEKLQPDNIKKFSERECMKGSLGVIEHGWELLPMIMKMIRS